MSRLSLACHVSQMCGCDQGDRFKDSKVKCEAPTMQDGTVDLQHRTQVLEIRVNASKASTPSNGFLKLSGGQECQN
jgi:hypothetical protein